MFAALTHFWVKCAKAARILKNASATPDTPKLVQRLQAELAVTSYLVDGPE